MKYMTMCGDVRIKIIPVINTEDIEMSSIAYKEVQKLVTYTFGLLDCIIEKDEMGKPFFQKHLDYDLSISHTDGLVSVAVGKNHKIGIDVEKIHKVSTTIINKYYSKSEKKALSRNRVNTELIETKIWTMKEAYSKCLGTGLNRDLLMWDTYSRKGIVMETQIYKEYVITVCRMIESM